MDTIDRPTYKKDETVVQVDMGEHACWLDNNPCFSCAHRVMFLDNQKPIEWTRHPCYRNPCVTHTSWWAREFETNKLA